MHSLPPTTDIIATFHREGITFGKIEASSLVGGRTRLEKLVAEGRIRMEKPTMTQNGKWFCNGGDVLCYVKNKPRKKRKTPKSRKVDLADI